MINHNELTIILPTFNEEKSIESVVSNYINQKYVESVLIVDNNSSDNTVKLAEKNGARVITKKENKGFSHSYILGLKEALKTDANIIVVTESDGTFDGNDLNKLLQYL